MIRKDCEIGNKDCLHSFPRSFYSFVLTPAEGRGWGMNHQYVGVLFAIWQQPRSHHFKKTHKFYINFEKSSTEKETNFEASFI